MSFMMDSTDRSPVLAFFAADDEAERGFWLGQDMYLIIQSTSQ